MSADSQYSVETVRDRVLVPAYLISLPLMGARLPLNAQLADIVFLTLLVCTAASIRLRQVAVHWFDGLVLLYVGAMAISLLDAPLLRAGLGDLLKTLSGVAVYAVFGELLRRSAARARVISWLARLAMAVSAVGLAVLVLHALLGAQVDIVGSSLRLPFLGSVLRLRVGFFTPELFGNFLTGVVTLALGYFLYSQRKPLRFFLSALVLGVTEIFTFSHSWAGFTLAMVMFCWPMNIWPSHWLRRAALVVVVGLVLVVNAASTFYVDKWAVEVHRVVMPASDLPEHVVQTKEWPQINVTATYNYMYYLILKVIAWESFTAHPINGLGVGNFSTATEQAYADGRIQSVCRACLPHSTLAGHLAESGVVGGAALVALWVGVFVLLARLMKLGSLEGEQWMLWALVAAFAGLLVNSINVDIMHFRFVWVLLGLMRGFALSEDERV